MRAHVFTDSALAKYAGRFVWLSINSDHAANEAFTAKYPTNDWPTLAVIDPKQERVELRFCWPADVGQVARILEDGEGRVRAAWAGNAEATDALERQLAAAEAFTGANQFAQAALAYSGALKQAPAEWGRRPEVTAAALNAFYEADDLEQCAKGARELAPPLPRGATFASVVSIGLACLGDVPEQAVWRSEVRAALEALGLEAVKLPDVIADERANLYEALVGFREEAGDKAGARRLAEESWAALSREAERASTPRARVAFDAHRLAAALELGDAARMLPVLEASKRDFPDDFDPPSKLAKVYLEMGRYDDALAANAIALSKVYGTRKLRVLWTQADIYGRMGKPEVARKTLAEALDAAKTMPKNKVTVGEVQRLEGLLAKLKP
jgi:tetratricopeptide (TPR) repeat protein